MTVHGIVATPGQLKAAEDGVLKAFVVPLVPQPELENGLWHWRPNCMKGLKIWQERLPFGREWNHLLDYKVGDEIYLKEQWLRHDEGIGLKSAWAASCPGSEDDEDWQTAEAMPPEAANYRFVIEEVFVERGRMSFGDYPTKEAIDEWNRQYPQYPLSPNLFVVMIWMKPCRLKF